MGARVKLRVRIKDGHSITLEAPSDPSPENDAFFEASPDRPSGSLWQLWGVAAAAAGEFEDGKDYFVDITPA